MTDSPYWREHSPVMTCSFSILLSFDDWPYGDYFDWWYSWRVFMPLQWWYYCVTGIDSLFISKYIHCDDDDTFGTFFDMIHLLLIRFGETWFCCYYYCSRYWWPLLLLSIRLLMILSVVMMTLSLLEGLYSDTFIIVWFWASHWPTVDVTIIRWWYALWYIHSDDLRYILMIHSCWWPWLMLFIDTFTFVFIMEGTVLTTDWWRCACWYCEVFWYSPSICYDEVMTCCCYYDYDGIYSTFFGIRYSLFIWWLSFIHCDTHSFTICTYNTLLLLLMIHLTLSFCVVSTIHLWLFCSFVLLWYIYWLCWRGWFDIMFSEVHSIPLIHLLWPDAVDDDLIVCVPVIHSDTFWFIPFLIVIPFVLCCVILYVIHLWWAIHSDDDTGIVIVPFYIILLLLSIDDLLLLHSSVMCYCIFYLSDCPICLLSIVLMMMILFITLLLCIHCCSLNDVDVFIQLWWLLWALSFDCHSFWCSILDQCLLIVVTFYSFLIPVLVPFLSVGDDILISCYIVDHLSILMLWWYWWALLSLDVCITIPDSLFWLSDWCDKCQCRS